MRPDTEADGLGTSIVLAMLGFILASAWRFAS